jgi:hypothetical protein
MSTHAYEPPRPTLLTLVILVSFLLSVFDVAWFVITTAGLLGVTLFSFLGGPLIGGAVSIVVGFVLLIAFVRFFLSILLFTAAWYSWRGDPLGWVYHRRWAWITIALDVLALILTFGVSAAGWWGLIYAILVLYVMDQPDVRAYFHRQFPAKPSGILDDAL